MSVFDELWGDEFTETDVAECVELETQASQVPLQDKSHQLPFQRFGKFREPQKTLNSPGTSVLAEIPRILQTQPYNSFRDDQRIQNSTSSSSTSSSSSPFLKLSESQRKLKTPVRSLPEISPTQLKERNQAATTEWLRKELEKSRKTLSDLEQTKQTLEGEVKLLRERNKLYQNQVVKVREQAEIEFTQKEEKLQTQLKDLKKESESAKIQLVLKAKESEANLERYLELKNVSVLEPEFPNSQMPKDRSKNRAIAGRTFLKPDTTIINVDDDNEDDYFSDRVLTKRPRRDPQSDLKTYSCDELIRMIDAPKSTPTKNRDVEQLDISMSDHLSPLKPQPEPATTSSDNRTVVIKRLETHFDLGTKFPWLKSKCYSLGVHQGQLLYEEIADKVYTLSDPEIKVIVTPVIDFDPSNVLKMDCSDLQYLEDLEKGEKIWGVDLKTMYDNDQQITEEPHDNDPEALETVKTILGSQMCGQSPDQSKFNESILDLNSPDNDVQSKVHKTDKLCKGEESILLKNLEPIHVHLKALTKLSNWGSSMDLISSIVSHLTLMINELHERVCDPRIPDQLKDQFYNNEFAAGNLFMNGPYEKKDLFSHEKWTERERYVELRRGVAVLAVLCSLSKDTVNLVLNSQLLVDVNKHKDCILTSKSDDRIFHQDSFLSTTLRNQSHRKLLSKAEESVSKLMDSLKVEDNLPGTSNRGALTSNYQPDIVALSSEIPDLLLKRKSKVDDKSNKEADNESIGSASTVNADEIMDIDAEDPSDGIIKSSAPRSYDEICHETHKAWYELYTQNKSNLNVEESGSKSQKYNRLLDPHLTDSERKELSIYLRRRKCYQDFYKAVAEKGTIWVPDKSDENNRNADPVVVKNLYDYENEMNINTTITSAELISMKPGSFHAVNDETVAVDTEIAIQSQAGSSGENEWRVNSLQKNQEDPNLAKMEQRKIAEDKNLSFFEKFKAINNESGSKGNSSNDISNANTESRLKPSTSKLRKHSLAPLRKRGGREITPPPESFNNINKEMEMEVEMLYGKPTGSKRPDNINESSERQILSVMAPFNPELRFPDLSNDTDRRSETLDECLKRLPSINDPNFEDTLQNYYNQSEEICTKRGFRMKPFKKLNIFNYLSKKQSLAAEEAKKKSENRGINRTLNTTKAGPSRLSLHRNQDESDAIISMLNDEALKYNLKKNIKIFERNKGNLSILDGIHEIVFSINYCRLTLVFYPLLSSSVALMESLFKHSYNNACFTRENFILIMKIINEITCCQPPPDIIEKILGVLIHAVRSPDIVECLCKKRSNLVSLVTKTEFCFFKGVCMMQPLCYLVGSLSSTSYPGYWSLSLTFTRWLRQLYEKYREYLEAWYPPSTVCNCIPVIHNSLFSTLAKATSFRANHGSNSSMDETQRKTLDEIIQNGIRLSEILIELDNSFKSHLHRFDLYHEFLCTTKQMHYDPHFFPTFQIKKDELAIVECLINANELLASSGPSEQKKQESNSTDDIKNHFNRVFDPNHIFLSCAGKYDLQC